MSEDKFFSEHWDEEMRRQPGHNHPVVCALVALGLFAIAALVNYIKPLSPEGVNGFVTCVFIVLAVITLFVGLCIEGAIDLDVEEKLRKAYRQQ